MVVYVRESIRDDRISCAILPEVAPCSLNIPSTTEISVEVVSIPQKAVQSFTTKPAPSTSLPRLTVPATNGICSNEDNSSRSATLVRGCTYITFTYIGLVNYTISMQVCA